MMFCFFSQYNMIILRSFLFIWTAILGFQARPGKIYYSLIMAAIIRRQVGNVFISSKIGP
jgi:hypothetical protein